MLGVLLAVAALAVGAASLGNVDLKRKVLPSASAIIFYAFSSSQVSVSMGSGYHRCRVARCVRLGVVCMLSDSHLSLVFAHAVYCLCNEVVLANAIAIIIVNHPRVAQKQVGSIEFVATCRVDFASVDRVIIRCEFRSPLCSIRRTRQEHYFLPF